MNTHALTLLTATFVGAISVWALWAVFSKKVRDGIFGKAIYSVVALSGYGVVLGGHSVFFTPTAAGLTFLGSLAAAGVRHYFVVTWWPDVRAWLCKVFDCEHVLHQDTRRVKVERRKSR